MDKKMFPYGRHRENKCHLNLNDWLFLLKIQNVQKEILEYYWKNSYCYLWVKVEVLEISLDNSSLILKSWTFEEFKWAMEKFDSECTDDQQENNFKYPASSESLWLL